MCPYDSVFEIFEQIIQHILFLGTSPRKRMQFLAALESSKRELTEMPYLTIRIGYLYLSNFEITEIKSLLFIGTIHPVILFCKPISLSLNVI